MDAGSNLVKKLLFRPHWDKMMIPGRVPDSTSTTSISARNLGTITWYLRMGDSRVRVALGVVQNLGVSVLLAKTSIDLFIKSLFQVEMKVVLGNSKPVQTRLLKTQAAKGDQKDNRRDGSILLKDSKDVNSKEFQIVQTRKLSNMSPHPAPMSTDRSRTVHLSLFSSLSKKYHCKMQIKEIDRLKIEKRRRLFFASRCLIFISIIIFIHSSMTANSNHVF